MRTRRLTLLMALLAAAACTSPEASRQRAGGRGADVGNHGEIELHAGSDPYYRTPVAMPARQSSSASASPRQR